MDININQISGQLHIPPEVYRRILEKSLTTTAEDIVLLQKVVSEGNYDQVRFVAHRLKGIYSNLHIEELRQAAEALQTAAKSDPQAEEIGRLFQVFCEGFEELKTSLDRDKG
jgi:HPt (histidine-containing phosphotransfer) domain-containing protein